MLHFNKQCAALLWLVSCMLLIAACGADSPVASGSVGPASGSSIDAASRSPASVDSVKQIELIVSAAASLADALKEIQPAFEHAYPDLKLRFNFGSSGALQRQIEHGAPVDLFLSADGNNMAALVDKQLIDSADQTALLSNELVVVVPQDSKVKIAGISDLTHPALQKIALGIPESVPAGFYAKEALTKSGIWDTLHSRLVQAKDVRQVLYYVETGNVDAGFVYKTDALTSDKIDIAFAVDTASYAPIEYAVGMVKETKHMAGALKLYHYLQSQAALDMFNKHGFSVLAVR